LLVFFWQIFEPILVEKVLSCGKNLIRCQVSEKAAYNNFGSNAIVSYPIEMLSISKSKNIAAFDFLSIKAFKTCSLRFIIYLVLLPVLCLGTRVD
jgi:hypothetical protein